MTSRAAETRKVLHDTRTPGKIRILLRMPNWLGDCIMALPAFRLLREALPGADIVIACRESVAELMAAQPGVDNIVITRDKGVSKLISTIIKGSRELEEKEIRDRIDLGVLFTNSLSTALWMWRANVKNRVGYDLDARRFFLTHPVLCDKRIHALHFVDYYIELAKRALNVVKSWQNSYLVVENVLLDEEFLIPQIVVGADGEARADRIVTEAGVRDHYAVIAPASAYGPVKDWPPDYYRQLVWTIVNRYDMPVFVTGGPGQHEVCETISAEYEGVHNLAGKTDLGSFLGLLAGSSLFVGGDSGGAHAAAAFGVPTLVIFGITNPARTFPSGENVSMLGTGSRQPIKLDTPEAKAMAEEALRNISVEDAADALELLLED